MVTTPGSNIINMLEMKPGPSSDEMATALTTLLHEEQDVKRQKGGGGLNETEKSSMAPGNCTNSRGMPGFGYSFVSSRLYYGPL